jgi:hypothetical protein
MMSVVEIDEANGVKIATCVWINGAGNEMRGIYPFAVLVPVP